MASNLIPGQAAGDALAKGGSTTSSAGDTWMKLAKDAYSRSTTYYENNFRKAIEDNLRLFNSQHPRDSKYNSEAYRYRSKIFRPKSRSVVRKHEATAAMAFFSNPDVLSIDPMSPSNQRQAYSAMLTKELMQYRLTKSIPWFATVLGAFQDTLTVGICASFNYWDYATRKTKVTKQAMFGDFPISIEVEEEVPVMDKPCIDLIPINHLRFDPAAKWTDVVNTSPYLIVEMPMYLRDVLDRMQHGYGKGEEKWKSLAKQTILQARITDFDPVQQARENQKEDPNTVTSDVNEFDLVMVHLNFIKTKDGTFTFYTLKDLERLSEPKSIDEVFLHGQIPVTVGFCIIEAHKALPNGLVQLGAQLQQEANEIANQRLDNVKLVLNKRWIVRRGANIDVESMLRNVPGGVTMANDTEKDVREVNWADVTSSSFQEQDRLNADFDDLAGGGLNSSSVMTNRRLNETVGGMRMMAQGSNVLTEYALRVFVETWVEPTLRQLMLLEQHYESDLTIIGIAADQAGLIERFNESVDLDALLKQELSLNINVGMGATDPDMRFQHFMQAAVAYGQIATQGAPDYNLPEIRKELFGLAGFKDNARFFTQVDPRLVQAQQMMQQAEMMAKEIIDAQKEKLNARERHLDNREHEIDIREVEASAQLSAELQKLQMEFALKRSAQAFEFAQKSKEMQQGLALEKFKAQQDADIAWFKAEVDAAIKKYTAQAAAKAKAIAGPKESAE